MSDGDGLVPVLGISRFSAPVGSGETGPADKNRYAPMARRASATKENNPTPIHVRLRAGFGVGSGVAAGSSFASGTIWFDDFHVEEVPLDPKLEEDPRALSISQFPNSRLPNSAVLILGNEVTGVDPELLDLCEQILYIPMLGEKKSFNVSIAFGIAAYALHTQPPAAKTRNAARPGRKSRTPSSTQ